MGKRLGLLVLALTVGCGGAPEPRLDYAIAIHGGAGVIPKDTFEAKRQEYEFALAEALRIGQTILKSGGTSLDAVEQVVRYLEDDPKFNAGKGAVFTHDGTNELDAAIMDGSNRSCGAVTGVTTIKNPISLARLVMERSEHVFFSGDGAERFATEQGVAKVDPGYFFTQERYDALQRALQREREAADAPGDGMGTVGAVALDRHGNLAAATSTGGLTNKRFGRIGDVPVIGAGTYADNATCAVSCTGKGEQFIRNVIAHRVSTLMADADMSLAEAARKVISGVLSDGDGGLIAVGRDGSIAMVFNTGGMFRGAADSEGRFEVAIWEDEPVAADE